MARERLERWRWKQAEVAGPMAEEGATTDWTLRQAIEWISARGKALAQNELWERLRQGKIQASGIDAPGVQRKLIANYEWSDLNLFRNDIVFAGDVFTSSSHAYFRVRIDRSAIVSIWPEPKAGDEEERTRAEATPEKSKGGRRPSHDWGAIKEKCFELLDYHDGFLPNEPEWNCQARLEEALKSFCSEKLDQVPADSSLRSKLPAWRKEWLSLKLKT